MVKKFDGFTIMKKQISVYALLIAVMICLIGSLPVQAAVVDGAEYDYVVKNSLSPDVSHLFRVEFTTSQAPPYKAIMVNNASNSSIIYLSHEPFSVSVYERQYDASDGSYINYNPDYRSAIVFEAKNQNGDTVHMYYMSVSTCVKKNSYYEAGSYSGVLDETLYPDVSAVYQAYYDIYTGNTNIPGYEANVPEFSEDQAALSSDIGYLQNVRINDLADKVSSMTTEIAYNSLTSTGFNIQQDNVKVEARITVTGVAKYGSMINGILPFVNPPPEIPDYSVSELVSTEKLYVDFTSDYKSSLFEKWASQVTWLLDLEYTYNYAVRVCVYDPKSNSWKYGGWIKITDQDGNWRTYSDYDFSAGVEDSDGTFIPDNINSGNYDGGFGYGYGDDLDQARDNIVSSNPDNGSSSIEFSWSGITNSIQDLLDNLASLISSVGQFPSLFAKVFSFLPSSIINLIYAAIVMAVLLRLFGR